MITDQIRNILLYKFLPENIKSSLIFLENTDFSTMANGSYDLHNNVYFSVQRYQTKLFIEGKLEIHKKYMDIQYIVEGTETLGYDKLDNLEITDQYIETNDIAFYKLSKNTSQIILQKKDFCVLFPNTPHMPGKYIDNPSNVIKVVMKIPFTIINV